MKNQRSPLVIAVTQKLQGWIASGLIPPGSPFPAERMIASKLGVSRSTVREAIKQLESNGVLVCQSGCRPVVSWDSPKPERVQQFRHVMLWLWPSPGHFMSSWILRGIQSAIDDPAIRLVVGHAPDDGWEAALESEARFIDSVADDPEAMGVILWYIGAERNLPSLKRLRSAGVPMVFIDRLPPEGFEADFVGTDNVGAARRGVGHLANLGHRRIALVSNTDPVSSVREREQGYRMGLKDSGLVFDGDYVYRDPVDGPEGVEQALSTLLALPDPPTAIFGVNDHVALQLHDALQSRGCDVPRDMSILGFDGLLRWFPGGGFLTSLTQDFERIGQIAAEELLARSSGLRPAASRHVLIDAPISIQGSTGPPFAQALGKGHLAPSTFGS